MQRTRFERFFSGMARRHLLSAIQESLQEDGPDLTSNAVFSISHMVSADIVAKQETMLVGLYLIPIILEETALFEPCAWNISARVKEGDMLVPGEVAVSIQGGARLLLRAERVILNFMTHLCGIADVVRAYVKELEGTGVALLDTRKTLPGLRYPEKYAVLVGGGCNHRKNLGELLMLKDNHIDAAGGVQKAVRLLRGSYGNDVPIEVECRDLAEVREAVVCKVKRIMLDNMFDERGADLLQRALSLVPPYIETEVSGGVTLANIGRIARVDSVRKPDFISVGRLTHSAPAADLSMRIT